MKLTPRHNVFRFCLPMMAAGISIHTHAAELLFSLAPSASHSQLGSGFAPAGDVDGDGVDDEFDTMPNSNMDPTIILAGGDSGVPNRVDENGTSLADVYAELGAVSDYHAPALYLSNATVLNNKLVKNGLINKNESRDILAAVRDALLGKNKNR